MDKLKRYLGFVGICLIVASCSSDSDNIDSFQDTVDSFSALTQHLSVPDHFLDGDFTRMESDFDVNIYFTVLDHLSMEPGYVLDYVYRLDHLGGGPVIYARTSDQLPYARYEDFLDAIQGLYQPTYEPSWYGADYLEHVVVDDTAEGYFQLAVLYVLGDQFYLYWHANYNDYMIVCNQDGLDAVWDSVDASFGGENVTFGLRQKARGLDLEPTVELKEDVAVVRFVTFTKWGGFSEVVYTISREFPHRIVDWEGEILLEYDCGVVF